MNKTIIDKFRHQLYGTLDNKVDIQLIQELIHEINHKFNQEFYRNLIPRLLIF